MKLEPRATAAGVRLIAHEVLGSTNTEALHLAGQGERPAHSPKALPNTGWSKGLVSNAGW